MAENNRGLLGIIFAYVLLFSLTLNSFDHQYEAITKEYDTDFSFNDQAAYIKKIMKINGTYGSQNHQQNSGSALILWNKDHIKHIFGKNFKKIVIYPNSIANAKFSMMYEFLKDIGGDDKNPIFAVLSLNILSGYFKTNKINLNLFFKLDPNSNNVTYTTSGFAFLKDKPNDVSISIKHDYDYTNSLLRNMDINI